MLQHKIPMRIPNRKDSKARKRFERSRLLKKFRTPNDNNIVNCQLSNRHWLTFACDLCAAHTGCVALPFAYDFTIGSSVCRREIRAFNGIMTLQIASFEYSAQIKLRICQNWMQPFHSFMFFSSLVLHLSHSLFSRIVFWWHSRIKLKF